MLLEIDDIVSEYLLAAMARGRGPESRTSPIPSPFRDPGAFECSIISMNSINFLIRHAKYRLLVEPRFCP